MEFKFQFPPPRGGEPLEQAETEIMDTISIPAPARGRTKYNVKKKPIPPISIPAPARGRTSKTAQNRAVYLVSLLKFGRISAILPYILSATRAKKRETPKIIGFLLRRPTGRSCTEQVGAGGVR